MKKLFCFMLLTLTLAIAVFSQPIHKYVDKTELTSSVALFKVREFHEDYNLSYSYIKVDLTDDNTGIRLLKPTNPSSEVLVNNLDTVTGIANGSENVIAALNADFFSRESGNNGFSLGIELQDGILMQSPIYPETMATISIENNNVAMSYIDFDISVLLPDGTSVDVRHLNKVTTYFGDVLMYTKNESGIQLNNPSSSVMTFIFDENDNTLKSISYIKEPFVLDSGTYALVVDTAANPALNSLKVGDSIEPEIHCSIDLESIDTAFGGGSMLVDKGRDVGKIGDYTHTVAGFNPRSAIGVTEDNSTLYLVAVDGRQSSSRGMRMSHLAELLIDLGCYYGVNLDGGGSTNMVAQDVWNGGYETVNRPTENRKVINAVGVVHAGEDTDDTEPCGIIIRSDRENLFIRDSMKFDVTVHDKFKRKTGYDETKLEWSATSGEISDGVFYPEHSGPVTISATYGELYADITVNVIGDVSGIVTDKKIHMERGFKEKISVSVFDYMGNNAEIYDLSYLKIEPSNTDVAEIDKDTICAVGDGNCFVKVSYGDVSAYITVSVGSTAKDYLHSFESDDFEAVVYPDDTKGDFRFSDDYAYTGSFSGKFSYNFNGNSDTVTPFGIEKEDITRAIYCKFPENIPIDEYCKEITMYVYAKQPFVHKLCAAVEDDNGNESVIVFEGNIEVGRWSKVAAEITRSEAKSISLAHIYLLKSPGEENDNTEIYIDDLSFKTYEKTLPGISPSDCFKTYDINSNVTSFFRVGTLSDSNTVTPLTVYGDNLVRNALGDVSNSFLLGEGKKMSVGEDKDAFYIHIDTSGGGIRKTDKEQWKRIVSLSENNSKKYLFVTCDTSIFGDDEFENEVIIDYFKSIDKQVFVIMAGDTSNYTDYGNLKLFTLDNTPTSSAETYRNKASNVIEFKLGDRVTFEFLNR